MKWLWVIVRDWLMSMRPGITVERDGDWYRIRRQRWLLGPSYLSLTLYTHEDRTPVWWSERHDSDAKTMDLEEIKTKLRWLKAYYARPREIKPARYLTPNELLAPPKAEPEIVNNQAGLRFAAKMRKHSRRRTKKWWTIKR